MAAALLAAPVAFASPSDPALGERWRWSHFTTASGLPSDCVLTVVEIGGTLWAVTRNGLAIYDGYRWHTLRNPQLSMWPPYGLSADGGTVVAVIQGRLFVGGAAGLREMPVQVNARSIGFRTCARASSGPVLLLGNDAAIYEMEGGVCRLHEPSRALGRVIRMEQAGRASVWVSSELGLSSWDGTRWKLRLPGGGPAPLLSSATEGADGSALAYVAGPLRLRGLWTWAERGVAKRAEAPTTSAITALTASGSETVAVYDTGEAILRAGRNWAPLPHNILDARAGGYLSNGDLWLATDHGLYVNRRSARRWNVSAVPGPDARNSVNEIARTPDGRTWLGTNGPVIEATALGTSTAPASGGDDAPVAATGLATDANGLLWATSGFAFTGARWRDAGGTWHRAVVDRDFDSAYFHKVVADRHGNLWFLGLAFDADDPHHQPDDSPGAFRMSPDGRVERWSTDRGLPAGRVYAFAEDRQGACWFGTASGGLSRWQAGRWRHWTTADGLRTNRVFALAVDDAGAVWFAHQSGGVGRLDHGTIQYATMADGLATDAIWTISIDDRHRVWAGGEGGVSMLDKGTWTSFDVHSGLPNARIWPILVAGRHVCVGTLGGGLLDIGLAAPSTPPLVEVDAPAVADGRILLRWRAFAWWGETDPEAVPTRVRLDDGRWTPWGTARELHYGNLPAGHHVLTVQAKGLLGDVSDASSQMAFDVPPPVLLRPLFYVPVGILALAVVGLLTVLAARQRRHHRELHRRERQFIRAFRRGPVAAAVIASDDGKYLETNSAFERLTGRAREDLIGHTGTELGLSVDDDLARAPAVTAAGSNAGTPLRVRDSSGGTHDVIGYLHTMEFGARPAHLVQLVDVTERRRLEDQLRQAQKMESIGRLAGGVAHDFNNLLTVIVGNASLLETELESDDPRHEEVEQVKLACDRAERLTRQLLACARRQVVEPRIVNVNDVVLRTDRMLRRVIGEDIELVTMTGQDLDTVLIDPAQLEQIILNMAVNARDAMPAGGTLTVSTSNIVIDEREAARHADAGPGRFVRLTVADTGTGMDPATLSRLFEPFFTTKPAGKGTGLGLATCYGVVKQAGGHILVESQPGRGATFHVDLPRAEASASRPGRGSARAEASGGAETVLLVEDEPQVRRISASTLRRRGYNVIEAGTGLEALDLAGRFDGRIDIVVTDVVMPLMTGTEMAAQLRRQRPATRVLYVSGYTDADVLGGTAGIDPAAFLGKPFTPDSLARKVREMLDAPAPAAPAPRGN